MSAYVWKLVPAAEANYQAIEHGSLCPWCGAVSSTKDSRMMEHAMGHGRYRRRHCTSPKCHKADWWTCEIMVGYGGAPKLPHQSRTRRNQAKTPNASPEL